MKPSVRLLALFVAVIALGVAGCGGADKPDNAPSAESDVDLTTLEGCSGDDCYSQDPSNSGEDGATRIYTIGQWGRSGDMVGRIESVKEAKTITFESGTQSDITPDGEAVTKKAGKNARFIVVRATVKNDSKKGVDLSCGGLVRPKLVDDENRNFSVISGIDQLPDQPACNVDLDPGFKDQITWVYRVPKSADPVAIAFYDDTDFNADPDAAFLGLSK